MKCDHAIGQSCGGGLVLASQANAQELFNEFDYCPKCGDELLRRKVHCLECGGVTVSYSKPRGIPRRYCGNTCKQRAKRGRQENAGTD